MFRNNDSSNHPLSKKPLILCRVEEEREAEADPSYRLLCYNETVTVIVRDCTKKKEREEKQQLAAEVRVFGDIGGCR